MTDKIIHISDTACERIAFLREQGKVTGTMFRITVLGGGCSGFQYKFDFDDAVADDDITFTHNETTVVTDTASMDFLGGATLNFVSDLGGSLFKIDNPNAEASCGCGTSFSPKMF